MTSDPFSQPIPVRVPPVDEEKEGLIVRALIQELNDIYGLSLDPSPDTERRADPTTRHEPNRTVLIGASHMARIKYQLEQNDIPVVGKCIPGWVPSKENVAEMAAYCASLKLCSRDLVVIDIWANSAIIGTDSDGMPHKAVKLDDGKYHVIGELQATPRTAFQTILKDMHMVLDAASSARILLLTPLPRYVGGGGVVLTRPMLPTEVHLS